MRRERDPTRRALVPLAARRREGTSAELGRCGASRVSRQDCGNAAQPTPFNTEHTLNPIAARSVLMPLSPLVARSSLSTILSLAKAPDVRRRRAPDVRGPDLVRPRCAVGVVDARVCCRVVLLR